jgi:hypothetical protein
MGGEFRTWAGGLTTQPDSNALQWVMHDSLVIVVQRTDSPPTTNWRPFIEHLQRSRVRRFLLFMLGNARLSATQRSDLVAHFKAHAQRVAVIAESDASRGTATALGWFFPDLKVFAPDELEGALASLALRHDEMAWVRHQLLDLLSELPGGDP